MRNALPLYRHGNNRRALSLLYSNLTAEIARELIPHAGVSAAIYTQVGSRPSVVLRSHF
jgi:hypothetical protein